MRLVHTALYVEDLEAVKEFYKKYFGAASNALYHNSKTGLKTYFLTFEGGGQLEIMTLPDLRPGAKADKFSGYTHIAVSTGSREGVDLLTERLRSDGYEIASAPRVTGDGFYESCVLDPEGNRVEITE